MKLKISREAKIGAFVLITLALAIWGFNYLSGKDIFKPGREYYAIYGDVSGLEEGSSVQVNGFSIGRVSQIQLSDQPGLVVVKFQVKEKGFRMPKDSQAKLISAGLLSGRVIEIILGSDTAFAKPGDTLRTGFELGLQEQVNEMVAPLKEKLDNLLSNIDSILIPIQTIVNEESASELAEAFRKIPNIINNLERVTYRVDTLLITEKARLGRIFGNVESITANLRNNNEKITSILENVDQITDSIASSNFKQAIENATNTLAKIDEIVARINNGEGTLGALIYDEKLYRRLDSAAENLNSLIADIENNPQRYLHFSFIHINRTKKTKDKGSPIPLDSL